jgi:hypothetical protein
VPADNERPVVNEPVPMEVMPVHEVVPVPEVAVPAEMPTAAMEAAEVTTAAATDLDHQIVGQEFRLRRRPRIHQRHRLSRDNRRRKRHQPRHREEAEQSLHL